MIRKYRRHAQVTIHRDYRLIARRVLLVGGALTVLMVGFLLVRARLQPPYVPEITGRPSARIDLTRFDYGTVPDYSEIQTTFHVKNVGDQQLFIVGEPQVEAVTGCCPPRTTVSQKFLNPGEEATVSMSFSMHPGMDGPHEYQVHVETTDPENPDQTVVILSNWVQQ